MKRFLYLLSVLIATSAFGADAANDFIFTQRKTDNSGNIQRNIPASGAATTAATFRSTLGIAGITGTTTSTAIATGTASQGFQTPSATTTLDSSGNISTPGGITTGAGGSAAGYFSLGQGTAASTGTTNITFYAPTSVTSYKRVFAGTVGSTGFPLYTVSGTTQTESLVAGTGTGNVVRSASPTFTGTLEINNATASNPAAISGTVLHLTGADSTNTICLIDTFTASNQYMFRRADGTSASPSALQSNDLIGSIAARGFGATQYGPTVGNIEFRADGSAWTDSSNPVAIVFNVSPTGSTSQAEAMRISQDKSVTIAGTLTVTGGNLSARATNLGTFASPNTAAGAITWVSPVYNIYTSAGSTRTYTLPAASSYSGQAFILNVAVGTGHVNVQPASGAQLVLAGVLLTADHYVQAATSAPGNYICFISDGTNWCSLGSSGTWADAASP